MKKRSFLIIDERFIDVDAVETGTGKVVVKASFWRDDDKAAFGINNDSNNAVTEAVLALFENADKVYKRRK
ncbi:hypothetical protein [Bacillus sp. MUM 13]|uniref:hypothetical protein n=1 Tax=Bacillus sp. MUM 13 TaxID=1678001 RepID=UPI0008F5CBE8|nr:hypothetical protein [Bacillus sp. MUM 13]OIK07145.1 hypothetical protein BIV59_21175 [Bacillus sp. MUM 13]